MPYPNPADIEALKKDANIELMSQSGMNIGYLALNSSIKPLDNPKVRKALNHAVNKQAIVDAVYQGAGQVAKNPIPPTMWGYNEDIKDYDYNPEKAKALLKKLALKTALPLNFGQCL